MAAFFVLPDGQFFAIPITSPCAFVEWLEAEATEEHEVSELDLRAYSMGEEFNALASEVVYESAHNVRGVTVLVAADGFSLDDSRIQNLYSLCHALRQLQLRNTHA